MWRSQGEKERSPGDQQCNLRVLQGAPSSAPQNWGGKMRNECSGGRQMETYKGNFAVVFSTHHRNCGISFKKE